ncbi:PAS domain-containing protein [Bradyrhizobium sp. S3.3.6]|uniref:protein DpdD n=1 Tax=Bradyrhizobium sp. S3.3.6 TaxID=3156429 RepID=UPI0033937E22
MICDTSERSAELHAKLDLISGCGSLGDEEIRKLCISIASSAINAEFPGGLVPVVEPSGDLRVYAVTSNDREWRQLSPLLLSFAGPTLTSFTGIPAQLRTGHVVEETISETRPAKVGVLGLPFDGNVRAQALRALSRLQDTWARAPKLDGRPTEPTGWLLAEFQDQINVGRREAAAAVIDRLRAELRLDALNIQFLEIQLFAAFSDWAAIVSMPRLSQLCAARRPPSVTATLLQAIYAVQLRDIVSGGNLEKSKLRYEETCRALVQPLLVLPPPPATTSGGWTIYAMEAIVDGDRPDIVTALKSHESLIGWLAAHVAGAEADIVRPPVVPATALDAARTAVVEADEINSLSAINAALAKLSGLSAEDLQKLRTAEPFKSALRELAADDRTPVAGPGNWVEWFQRAGDPSFDDALEIARRGKDEWPIGDREADPGSVRQLEVALEHVQADSLAGERAADALPLLVAWLRRDPEYPRPAFSAVYSVLLTLFALSHRRGRRIYESSGLLIGALLATGLSEKTYRDLLGDIDELLGAGIGTESLYWLLDVLEDTVSFPAPSSGIRESFWLNTLVKIQPLRSRLTGLQRASIAGLAQSVGWNDDTLESVISGGTADSQQELQSGLKIAIYTLTESAGRQAKTALESTFPSVVVDCSADHGGNPRLKAMAENADIFVVTTTSAKHAATEFIRSHRGERPLLFAQGRGFTSILRAIEDHVQGGASNTGLGPN